jgi:ribosomal-protein-alanine N-acetyltransferase
MLETPRLEILPLSYNQLVLYLSAEDKFEKEHGLTVNGRVVSSEVRDMVEHFTLPRMKLANDNDYLFYTFWLVIEKTTDTIVAELGFKGIPNNKGEIEIGYGTMPDQQGKGYMTEAVAGMIQWATGREDVEYILAETDENNHASIRVVQKNGFVQFARKGEMLWWRRLIVY